VFDGCCKKFLICIVKGWNPDLGALGAFRIVFFTGIFMMIIGLVMFAMNGNVITTDSYRYDEKSNFNQDATVTISVTNYMHSPVFVFLE